MKVVDFWFDALSPYAWLAFDRLPQALEGLGGGAHAPARPHRAGGPVHAASGAAAHGAGLCAAGADGA